MEAVRQMPFGLYIEWDTEHRPVETTQVKFSEALRLAEVTSTAPAVKYAAVVNESRQTLAAFAGGERVSLLTAAERDAVAAGRCRRAPKGCSGGDGPLGYCVDHFRDLVIYGDPGSSRVIRPESLNAVGALWTRLGRPRSLTDADMARGYELINENPGILAKELSEEFGVTTATVYRRFPNLRNPRSGRRLDDAVIARGKQLLNDNPRIKKSTMARMLGVSISTINNHFPEVTDGRRALSEEDVLRGQQMIRDNPRITLAAMAEEFGVQRGTIRRYFPEAARPLLDDDAMAIGKSLIRDGGTAKDVAEKLHVSLPMVYRHFSEELREAREARDPASPGDKKIGKGGPPRAVKTTRDEFPAPPIGARTEKPTSSGRRETRSQGSRRSPKR